MQALVNKFFNNTLFRFLLIGGLGLILNLIIFFVLADILKINHNLASIAAFFFAVSQNYLLNHLWSFKKIFSYPLSFSAYLKYFSVNLLGLAVNLIILNMLIYIFNPNLKISYQFLGIVAGTLFNYLGAKYFVFSKNYNFYYLIKKLFTIILNKKSLILGITLSSIFIFMVIWAGNIITVITSREILEPLTI